MGRFHSAADDIEASFEWDLISPSLAFAVLRRLVSAATIVGGARLPFPRSASRGVGRRCIASGGRQVRTVYPLLFSPLFSPLPSSPTTATPLRIDQEAPY